MSSTYGSEQSLTYGPVIVLPEVYGQRKIVHVDMDAFYAAVEILDAPQLKNLPVVVGGNPKSRGVVCTANYIARRYGIRSAMACSVAYRLCPEAVFLRPRFERYKELATVVRQVFERYTDCIQPLSLDEAYLDVTETCRQRGLFASRIARDIKQEIYEATGLTCSAGVAPNKLVAKIASEFRKPNGLTIVTPAKVQEFMSDLSIRKIHGIGPATEKRLNDLGIFHCRDVRMIPQDILQKKMGRWKEWLENTSLGIDHRPVSPHWERKSYGREETFAKDLLDKSLLQMELKCLTEKIISDLRRGHVRARTITLKVKYHNFERITRSKTLSKAICTCDDVFPIVQDLLLTKTAAGERPIRLIGLGVSNLESAI